MADDFGRPLSIEDFIPVTGKNYIAPHIIQIVTGTVYTNLHYSRAVLLIPQTPATVGTTYIYPNTYPGTDTTSIPIPAGNNVYLDARGDWYIRTTSAGTEKFLVIDAGAAGNAAAIAQSFGPAAGASSDAPVIWTTAAAITVNAADTVVLAANTARRGLSLFNSSTAGQIIAVTTENPATAVTRGIVVLAAGQGVIWNPHDCPTQQALRAFASAASGSLTVSQGV